MGRARELKQGSSPVVIEPQLDWPRRATALSEQLHGALGPIAERIEHIGSTAIPEMPAKDVLDVQVSVSDLATAEGFDLPLHGLGFARSPYDHDHVPAGSDHEPGRWVKRLWVRRKHVDGDVNLHVRQVGSPNERMALLFRDWFRTHPEAVPAYGSFKRALAGICPDLHTYTDVKDPVVDLVVVIAEAWASESGWKC